jgi:hypothetical protein
MQNELLGDWTKFWHRDQLFLSIQKLQHIEANVNSGHPVKPGDAGSGLEPSLPFDLIVGRFF